MQFCSDIHDHVAQTVVFHLSVQKRQRTPIKMRATSVLLLVDVVLSGFCCSSLGEEEEEEEEKKDEDEV